MEIAVSGRHMDVGEALRTHAIKELSEITEKYFDRSIEGNVVFDKNGHLFTVDITVLVGTGQNITIKGRGEASEAYAAFAASLERIAKQLRRYKRRLRNHHTTRDESLFFNAREYVMASNDSEEETDEHLSADNPVIIAETSNKIEAMAVKDAVMRMDLADSHVLLFRNSKNGHVNVVYRRPDGNIGWIDAEIKTA